MRSLSLWERGGTLAGRGQGLTFVAGALVGAVTCDMFLSLFRRDRREEKKKVFCLARRKIFPGDYGWLEAGPRTCHMSQSPKRYCGINCHA